MSHGRVERRILADADILDVACHHPVFPGEGRHHVVEFVERVEAKGYVGDYSLEVYNDENVQADPFEVTARAMRSVRWLQEGRSS